MNAEEEEEEERNNGKEGNGNSRFLRSSRFYSNANTKPDTGAAIDCEALIVRITNHSTLPDPERPEVFFSGALHGDEWVGPITTVEMAIALVEKAAVAAATHGE